MSIVLYCVTKVAITSTLHGLPGRWLGKRSAKFIKLHCILTFCLRHAENEGMTVWSSPSETAATKDSLPWFQSRQQKWLSTPRQSVKPLPESPRYHQPVCELQRPHQVSTNDEKEKTAFSHATPQQSTKITPKNHHMNEASNDTEVFETRKSLSPNCDAPFHAMSGTSLNQEAEHDEDRKASHVHSSESESNSNSSALSAPAFPASFAMCSETSEQSAFGHFHPDQRQPGVLSACSFSSTNSALETSSSNSFLRALDNQFAECRKDTPNECRTQRNLFTPKHKLSPPQVDININHDMNSPSSVLSPESLSPISSVDIVGTTSFSPKNENYNDNENFSVSEATPLNNSITKQQESIFKDVTHMEENNTATAIPQAKQKRNLKQAERSPHTSNACVFEMDEANVPVGVQVADDPIIDCKENDVSIEKQKQQGHLPARTPSPTNIILPSEIDTTSPDLLVYYNEKAETVVNKKVDSKQEKEIPERQENLSWTQSASILLACDPLATGIFQQSSSKQTRCVCSKSFTTGPLALDRKQLSRIGRHEITNKITSIPKCPAICGGNKTSSSLAIDDLMTQLVLCNPEAVSFTTGPLALDRKQLSRIGRHEITNKITSIPKCPAICGGNKTSSSLAINELTTQLVLCNPEACSAPKEEVHSDLLHYRHEETTDTGDMKNVTTNQKIVPSAKTPPKRAKKTIVDHIIWDYITPATPSSTSTPFIQRTEAESSTSRRRVAHENNVTSRQNRTSPKRRHSRWSWLLSLDKKDDRAVAASAFFFEVDKLSSPILIGKLP